MNKTRAEWQRRDCQIRDSVVGDKMGIIHNPVRLICSPIFCTRRGIMIRELSYLMREYYHYPLFGMLLFTDAHPHIIKMLRDPDYYSALDMITGDNIALFSTMVFHGEFEYPSPPSEMFAKVLPVWKEPIQNMKVLPWFDIRESRVLPILVVFCHNDGNIYFQKHAIKAESSHDCFNNINKILSRISEVINQVKGADGINKVELFRYAQWEMRVLETEQRIVDLFEAAATFRSAIGI